LASPLLCDSGVKTQESISSCIRKLQINPQDVSTAGRLADLLYASGRWAECIAIRQRMIDWDDSALTHLDMADLYQHIGENEKAMYHYQKASLHASDDAEQLFRLYKNMGNVFAKQQDFEQAHELYCKAHRLRPDSDLIAVNLGTIALQQQNLDEAYGHFRAAISLCRANDRAWVTSSWLGAMSSGRSSWSL
jgi:tetratricopeptide (TPR) repeat protein